jgi:hypothetical protein
MRGAGITLITAGVMVGGTAVEVDIMATLEFMHPAGTAVAATVDMGVAGIRVVVGTPAVVGTAAAATEKLLDDKKSATMFSDAERMLRSG